MSTAPSYQIRTCWSNCPNTEAITAMLASCPASYPNANRPNCTPIQCWKDTCPTSSVMTFGSCPVGYPSQVKPSCNLQTCWSPCPTTAVSTYGACPQSNPYTTKPNCGTDLPHDLTIFDDNNAWGNETAGSGNDGGWKPDDVVYVTEESGPIVTQLCWSGCPNPNPTSVIGTQCIAAFPYSEKPSCGEAEPTVEYIVDNSANEAYLAQIQALQQQLQQSYASQNNNEEIEALMALYSLQQEQLNQALASQNSPQVAALENQLALLQAQLIQSQNRPQQTNKDALAGLQSQMSMLSQILMNQQMNQQNQIPQQGGVGDVPIWAVIVGIGLVATIAIVATAKK